MKSITFAEVVAVVALLCAVWAASRPRIVVVGESELREWSKVWGRRLMEMNNKAVGLTQRVEIQERRLAAIGRDYDERVGRCATAKASGEAWNAVERKIEEIQKCLERVGHGFIAATAPLSVDPWPEVLRTTSGEKPVIKNVEE